MGNNRAVDAPNVLRTHEPAGDFKERCSESKTKSRHTVNVKTLLLRRARPLEVEPETGADQMLLQIEIKFPLNVSNKPPCVGFSHGN